MHHSIEAEQSVLGACMFAPDAYPRVAGLVREQDFYRADHRAIWRAIDRLGRDGRAIDPVAVGEVLEQSGELEDTGGVAYLVQVVENTPSAANVETYARVVHAHAMRRQIARLCAEIPDQLHRPPTEVLAELQTQLDALQQASGGESLTWAQVLALADEAIANARKAALEGRAVGLPTGLPALDARTGGLFRQTMTVLAGRPGTGKTALSQQIVLHNARRGTPVGICSLEMSAAALGIRAFANVLGVNGTALRFGDREQVELYTQRLGEHRMFEYPIYVDVSTFSLGGIIARAHEWKHRHGIELLVVDHIGLVEEMPGDTRTERVGVVTRTLHKLAKRLDIAVLALCQLNRGMEKDRRKPVLADLRDSGEIEQDCDNALFLYRDMAEETEGPVSVEIGALKLREGRVGWLPQQFQFDGRTQRFMERESYGYAA